ncbi:MAG: glycosyltransferase family 4 protein [bacterium]
MKVLITTPSVDINQNVGGISKFVNTVITNNLKVCYSLFVRGQRDKREKEYLWLLNQPIVLVKYFMDNVKGPKIVHINMPMESISIIRDSCLVLISFILRKKVVIHIHGGLLNLDTKVAFIVKSILLLIFTLSSKVIVLSQKEELFYHSFYKIKTSKLAIIKNAINLNPVINDLKDENILNILYIGRLDFNKGLKYIVLALQQLIGTLEFNFYIAGDGKDKTAFLALCEKLIPFNYKYLGVVDGTIKEQLFRSAHIFVLPSLFEGLPYSLIEAMAYKLVPIVTEVGSIPELVVDNFNGYFVPQKSYVEISECIKKLSNNKKMMFEIGENAYSTIKNEYCLEESMTKLNNVYKELFNKNESCR